MKQQMFNFQIPTVLVNKLKKIAKKEGVSVAHLIRKSIKKEYDNG